MIYSKIVRRSAALCTTAAAMLFAGSAQAQGYDAYLGQAFFMAGAFCPKGSLEANGQLLSIANNQALFKLFGYKYGGKDTPNFALPNLAGRTMIGAGQAPGLSEYTVGESGGAESTTMTLAQLPVHTHSARMQAYAGEPDTSTPISGMLVDFPDNFTIYAKKPPNVNMGTGTVMTSTVGNAAPIPTRSPYVTIRICIAIGGAFPSQ